MRHQLLQRPPRRGLLNEFRADGRGGYSMAYRLCCSCPFLDVDQQSLTVDPTDRQTDDFANPQSPLLRIERTR